MPSVQEILVIALLIALFVIFPRRMGKAGSVRKSGNIMKTFSGKVRLGMLVSAIWLLSWSVYFRPWSGDLLGFALLGLCPVILGWGILWVVDGFKKDQGA